MLCRSYSIALAAVAACHVPTGRFHGPDGADAGDGEIDGAVGEVGADAGGTAMVCRHVSFSLAPAPMFTGATLSSIAVVDVDEDSYKSPDIVVTSAPTDGSLGTVIVLLNDGSGGFPVEKQAHYQAGHGPQAVLAADVDGKGFLDLAVANRGDNQIGVFLNQGGNGQAGTFQPMATYSVKGNPSWIGVGSFDPSAGLDLAVADQNVGGYVSILSNTGDGTFAPHLDIPTAAQGTPWSVAVTNLDGGAPDLLVTNHATGSVNALIGDGKGSFTTKPAVAVGAQPTSVAVGTLHSGAKPYIFVANSGDGTVSVMQYIDGSLSSVSAPLALSGKSPQFIVVKDLNGDDKFDLVIANGDDPGTVSVVLGNGDGTFQDPTFTMTGGVYPRSLAVEDMNGDGLPDIVVANESGTVNLLTSQCMP